MEKIIVQPLLMQLLLPSVGRNSYIFLLLLLKSPKVENNQGFFLQFVFKTKPVTNSQIFLYLVGSLSDFNLFGAHQCRLIGKTLCSFIPASNSLISVSDPWGSFWDDTAPLKGPQPSLMSPTETVDCMSNQILIELVTSTGIDVCVFFRWTLSSRCGDNSGPDAVACSFMLRVVWLRLLLPPHVVRTASH